MVLEVMVFRVLVLGITVLRVLDDQGHGAQVTVLGFLILRDMVLGVMDLGS